MRTPATPPEFSSLISGADPTRLIEVIARLPELNTGKYLHWDELRRRPTPSNVSHHEWWLAIKLGRKQLGRATPLVDVKAQPFSYCLADSILEKLPMIDAHARGSRGVSEQIINSDQRDRYIVSSLIEEAITSSQLEGAATTRKDGAELLRSGRAPRDKSEQMVLNNYLAMMKITELKEQPFSPELICDLHRIVTEHTLDNEQAAGRLQQPGDKRVAVWDESTGEVLHHPPPAEQLPERLQKLCDFANAEISQQRYMHPIVKAIILHFWLAYDHPFEDGNGRTARALFYWSALQQGYWLFEFLSISSLLRKAPSAYTRSYLYTETDDNDLSYFIIYQLEIILRSIQALGKYIERKSTEIHSLDKLLKLTAAINLRQKALLSNALKKPDQVYSIESHQRSHQIAYATSRSDLLKLAEFGLLQQFKVGKAMRFKSADNLEQRLRNLT